MSPTSVHKPRSRQRGFTLVEILVATSISAVIFAGILAAYLFVGRNLTRLVNMQRQEVESRRTLRYVTQDISAAIELTTATSSSVALTKPTSGGTTNVSYTYSAGTLSRSETGAATQTLLTGLTAFTITYYNESGKATTSKQSIKSAEIAFTSTAGSSNSGTLASYSTVSPRVILRNKQVLE